MSLSRPVSRRLFLGATATTVTTAGLVAVGSHTSYAAPPRPVDPAPFDLSASADGGKLALPRGFKATRVSTIGVEPLLDDRGGSVVGKTPSNLDGTGCFSERNVTRLVRNHECRANSTVPVPLVAGTVYDGVPTGMGGNTVVETKNDGTFVRQWVALSGTIRNCAGGETPWGSWLACEEDTTKAGTTVTSSVDGRQYVTKKDHGYVFEVFPDVVAWQIPLPIKAWGRAVWEGAAIGPNCTDAYLTEDTGGGLFYRWTAPAGTQIGPGIARRFGDNDGVLQAAQLVRNGTALRHYGELSQADLDKPYPVTWIDGGSDRQTQRATLRSQYPGATVHPKIEGCWSDGKDLWFTLSDVNAAEAARYGIDQDQGMVMYYDYAAQTLTLKVYYEVGNYFDSPDNITVSPWGTIVLAEDGSDPNHLIAWTPRAGSRPLAKDTAGRGEWAGPCFNRSGSVLFASVQSDCTYAITGPLGRMLHR